MAYATLEYYQNTYKGTLSTTTEVEKMLERASDDIDLVTHNSFTVDALTEYQLEQVKKACCAQAEYYVLNGETYNDSGAGSVTIGKFSMSGGSSGAGKTMNRRGMQYLDQAGLLFAGVQLAGGVYHE